MRSPMIGWLGVLGTVVALSGCAPPNAEAPSSAPFAMFDGSAGWIAADGASTLDLNDGRVLWLFGDTLVGSLKPDGGAAPGTVMVNNTLGIGARSVGAIAFHWGTNSRDGAPASWALSPAGRGEKDAGHWLWPAGGGVRIDGGIGDRVVLFFTMMRRKSDSTEPDVWNFEAHGSTAVTILNPADPVAEWRTEVSPLRDHEAAMDAGESVRLIAWGPAAMVDPEDPSRVLVYGVDVSEVMDKRLVLARSARDTLDEFDKWEFRTPGGWSNAEQDAASIASGAVDEFSVHRQRLEGRERYVLTQSEPNLGARVQVRFADRPEGPWSNGVAVYTCPEPASDNRLMVYSAKAHPEIDAGNGDELLVTYCVNSTDFWHMLGHPALYRPKLVRVPRGALEAAARAE